MIWPEFEDETRNIITQTETAVLKEGVARMWIIVPPMRKFHRDKINIGLKGFFMEGFNRVAECEVIELVDLKTNPVE